jgi:hypothetical protein
VSKAQTDSGATVILSGPSAGSATATVTVCGPERKSTRVAYEAEGADSSMFDDDDEQKLQILYY